MNIDLNLLIVFDAIWRNRQISRAAAELGTTQPTLSNALGRLRKSTDDALFVRGDGAMVPTPFAERLAHEWCAGLAAIRRGLSGKTKFDAGRDRREFSIIMTDIAEAVILPHLVEACRKGAPGISFRTVQVAMDGTLPALRSGEVDLAVGYIPGLRSGVKQQVLFETEYMALARVDHPSLQDGKLSKGAFLRCRHAVAEAQGTGHAIVERALRRHGLAERVGARVPHFLSIPMIVASSDFIATVPRPLGRLMAGALPVVVLPHPLKLPRLSIRQFWHERFNAEPSNRWLRRTLREALSGAEVLHET